MADPLEALRESEEGSYQSLAVRPKPPYLRIVFIPALAAVLLSEERKKGEPLTRQEVESIRDNAEAVVGTEEAAQAVQPSREYIDIEPEQAWEQWQAMRLEF